MCNCGKKRTTVSHQANPGAALSKAAMPQLQQQINSVFEYTGKTALTVIGNITGRRYRFNRPGDLQSIDARDIAGMLSVPVLRKR